MFQYQATVARVIDGDTVVMDVDLGFGVWMRGQSFRLVGLNAREHSDAGGPEATAHLESILTPGLVITVTSVKNDKFGGRFDAQLILADGTNLNQELVHSGWAAAWSGAGTKPVPPWPRMAT